MNIQEMIDKIYEVVADKSETMWCICEFYLPIELNVNEILKDWSLNSFVDSLFYEWVHMDYIKRVTLNWSVNVIDFNISELPPVFDKYKKYILRDNDQFYIKKISKELSSARWHNSLDENWDWNHWEDYFSKYNHNSKERYSVTYRSNVIDGRWNIGYFDECNSNIVHVIWHQVMIGDILDYLQSNNLLSDCIDPLWIWNNKREPIENQSEECIKYIYNLIIEHVPKKENSN